MKKQIYFLMLVLLLVMPMVMAKSLGSVEPIDWKTKKLMVTSDGVYDGKVLFKEIDKSEIWIDKKVEDTYHVDSLVADDTLVDIKLYYDIQPDTIDYISHNGKYQQLYTYNDWTWEENETGGWVILEVTLEYGTGSNTFASAISGATWMNDGVNNALTEDTHYTLSGATFTIIDVEQAWRQINTSYSYTTNRIEIVDYAVANDAELGLGEFGNWFKIIVIVGIASVILFLIISSFSRPDKIGGSY